MTTPSYTESMAASILDARTRALAERRGGPRATAARQAAPTRRMAVFQLGTALYGLAIEDIARVIPAGPTTPLPGAGRIVLGIAGVQGQVVTVIDLNAALGNPDVERVAQDHLIVLRRARPRLAFRCSRVLSVADLSPLAESDPSAQLPAGITGYGQAPADLAGRVNQTVALLDLNWVIGTLSRH